MLRTIAAAVLLYAWASSAMADLSLHVTFLKIETPERPVLSNLDPIPEDRGRAGAALGLADNQTTGQFMGHVYTLDTVVVADGEDPLPAARSALAASEFLILDAPAATQLAITDLPEAETALIFNASARDVALREENCRANLLHTMPSWAMKADALMQFLVVKRWTSLAMIIGTAPEDAAWATALMSSARKFGLRQPATKAWPFDADMRRNAAQEVPLFTQDLPEHDVLMVADVANDFARYIAYNTWLARPVAGSEGVMPAGWAPVIEQWGAVQLHSRFHDLAGRDMTEHDYAAWAAMRTLGEAVTRTNANDAETLRGYILSDAFELAAFKGRPQSFRAWNGQMRQPIALVTRSAVVAQAPFEAFLHQANDLDTLGKDQPETSCTTFN